MMTLVPGNTLQDRLRFTLGGNHIIIHVLFQTIVNCVTQKNGLARAWNLTNIPAVCFILE